MATTRKAEGAHAVVEMVVGASGRMLKLRYKDGEKTVGRDGFTPPT